MIPTKCPTLNPTTTTNPTHHPTANPTHHPSFQPTTYPSDNPSNNPTMTPTTNPTTFPTKYPTINPTIHPSHNPTHHPTANPTNHPSFEPTTFPSDIPSDSPTSDPSLDPTDSPSMIPTANPTTNPTANPTIDPTIQPSFVPTLIPTLNPTPLPKPAPEIIISVPSEIGRCDDLILDARSTKNVYGQAIFHWAVIKTNYSVYGKYTTIPNEIVLALPTKIVIHLEVTNKFNESSTITFSVQQSKLDIIPQIELHGINEISPQNKKLLGDKIDIYSLITFEDNCNDEDILIDSDNFNIRWFVHINAINNNRSIDSMLETFLLTQTTDSISIDLSYFESGFAYIFKMNFQCVGLKYDCNVNRTHSIVYKKTQINANIMGGNVYLNEISLNDFKSYTLVLDGYTFTVDEYKKHLMYKWQCIAVDNTTNDDCNYLITNINASITSARFDELAVNVNTTYHFIFELEVYDQITNRQHAFDQITLKFTVVDTPISTIIISATAINTDINIGERLRIVADWNGMNTINASSTMFKWSELSGQLTDKQINKMSASEANLVLSFDAKQSGNTFLFRLDISQRDENDVLIAFGSSSIIQINILSQPVIVENSFKAQTAEKIVYESIYEYLADMKKQSVSVLINDDQSFLFQFLSSSTFGNQTKSRYLHPSLLSTAYFDDAFLFVGNHSIIVNVYDLQSSMTSDIIKYEVRLKSYSVCPNTNYLNLSNSISTFDSYFKILQQSIVNLQYLHDYYEAIDDIDQCLEHNLLHILTVLDSQIGDLCEQYSDFVVMLSDVIDLWLYLAQNNDVLSTKVYSNSDILSTVRSLIFKVLDPCNLIRSQIGYNNTENMYTMQSAIIENELAIYYNDEDVTKNLSPIVTNYILNQDLLYEYIQSMFVSIEYYTNSDELVINEIGLDIENMLQSVLHISTLLTMSKFIPSEYIFVKKDEFEVYAIRTSDENVNISVNDIFVNIPKNILSLNSNDIFDSIDTLIVGYSENQKIVNTDYLLSNQSLSVTISGDAVNTSHLPSNIEFIFTCDDADDGCNDYQCVWHDIQQNKWEHSGCDTIFLSNKKILCSCSHLTTFAMIKSIKQDNIQNELLFSSHSWDYINWIFGAMFLILSCYIFLQIFPFYIDKRLSIRHPSVIVMSSLYIATILYFINCVQLHFLKYDFGHYVINSKSAIFFLLFLKWIYFMVYSKIFFTWFVLANSDSVKCDEDKVRMKKLLFIINIFILFFLITAYILIISIDFVDDLNTFFLIIDIIWTCILSILCIAFTIYSYYVAKMLYLSTKLSAGQNFEANAKQTMRRLITINSGITIFFLLKLIIFVYFTVNYESFSILYRAVDLFLNFIFIALICWMYRKPMISLVESDGSKQLTKFYNLCNCLSIFKKKTPRFGVDSASPAVINSQTISPSANTTEIFTESKASNGVQRIDTDLCNVAMTGLHSNYSATTDHKMNNAEAYVTPYANSNSNINTLSFGTTPIKPDADLNITPGIINNLANEQQNGQIEKQTAGGTDIEIIYNDVNKMIDALSNEKETEIVYDK